MKIVILMSVYNGSEFVKEQIDSIRRQSIGYENIRLMIRDDGSQDDSYQLIEEMHDSHIILLSGKNYGTADSFWYLVKNADLDADYYAFADQDDIWFESKIETAVKWLNNSGVPQLYYSNVEVANRMGEGTGKLLMNEGNHLSVPTIMAGLHALGCTMVFNRAALRLYQSARLTGIEMHDRSCFLMTYLMGQVIYNPMPQMYYRQHENNVIGNEGRKDWIHLKKRLRKSYNLWFRSRKHDAVVQAQDMLDNFEVCLKQTDRKHLYMIANYRKNNRIKWRLLKDSNIQYLDARVKRSYRLRILVNVF